MDEYGCIARLYDPLVGPALRPIHQAMAGLAGAPGSALLDLCCGTGLLAGIGTQLGLDVTGVDLSPHMLAVAEAKRPGPAYLLADAAALPLPDNRFDAVAVSFALHEKPLHIAAAILGEARRVLKDDGRILVADYLASGPGRGWFTGRAIHLVERLAGQDHHACFRQYLAAGGAEPLFARAGLSGRMERTFLHGWVGLYAIR
jgi:ubiquinone/menaquinone biosynthesis C-methylase UbiE